MPSFNYTMVIVVYLFFNDVITWFGVHFQFVSNHGYHFDETISKELVHILKFEYLYSSTYYLKKMDKSNWKC